MIQFYVHTIDSNNALLQADEFHHCIKVLRHQVGDTIPISNGKGLTASAQIDKIKKQEAHLKVLDVTEHAPKDYTLILAVAPPKTRARWEWLVEKSVEIGVTDIMPLITQRSERQKVNLERSRKVLRSAALQSLRPYHPVIHELIHYDKVISQITANHTTNYIASYRLEHKNLYTLNEESPHSSILIGPEGDFTESEIKLALEAGYIPVNISHNRLRTETAAIVACTIMARIML